MWYRNSYRRHLCDMHLEDWDEQFMSQFSPEQYVANLERANIDSPMIYLQSHVGLCYYPTKNGQMHKALIGREDLIRRTVDLCRKKGMPVVGYYSIIFNTREHDLHPEWRMLHANGASQRSEMRPQDPQLEFSAAPSYRYGLCCPNHPEYRQFVFAQVEEMLEYFTLDGLFFDMPFWEHTCYCPKCRARWEAEEGCAMPENVQPADPEFPTLARAKTRWMGEFIQEITDLIKKRNPEISVEYNFAASISAEWEPGCGKPVADASDFIGGDLYGGIYNHSAACKFFKNITQNQPFDYMFSRCKPRLSTHTLTKTPDQMKAEIMLTAAHHGATLAIDAMDPVGTMDSRFYRTLGELFDFQKQYELFFGGEMVEDVGIYYSIHGRLNPRKEAYNSLVALKQVTKTLISQHIPFGVTGDFYDLSRYKILIAPSVTELNREDFDRLEDYVRGGGNLYLSGVESEELITRFLGCQVLGRSEENQVYLAPVPGWEQLFLDFNRKYPLPFNGTAPLIRPSEDSEVLATLSLPYTSPREIRFASIHSNPPGAPTDYPTVIKRQYGKGTVIWSGLNLESVEFWEYNQIFLSLLGLFGQACSVTSNAPGNVELTLFRQEKRYLLHTVVLNEEAIGPTIVGFEVSIKMDTPPKEVFLAPDYTPIPFTYQDGVVTFSTRTLSGYDMYILQIT